MSDLLTLLENGKIIRATYILRIVEDLGCLYENAAVPIAIVKLKYISKHVAGLNKEYTRKKSTEAVQNAVERGYLSTKENDGKITLALTLMGKQVLYNDAYSHNELYDESHPS